MIPQILTKVKRRISTPPSFTLPAPALQQLIDACAKNQKGTTKAAQLAQGFKLRSYLIRIKPTKNDPSHYPAI